MSPTKHECAKGVLCSELVVATVAMEAMREAYLKEKQQAARLAGALKDLVRLRNAIEVMGEWSALDINVTSYRKTEEIVESAMETARKELDAWSQRLSL